VETGGVTSYDAEVVSNPHWSTETRNCYGVHMARADTDTVRLPGGETIPRRLEHKGATDLRPEGVPPVDIEGWEILDDSGGVIEFTITLRTQPGEPGMTFQELGAVNLAFLHHNKVLFEAWKRRATIRLPEDLERTGRGFDQLSVERRFEAAEAVRATSKRLRSPARSAHDLDEILEAFDSGGIAAVVDLGYSRSYAYKLVSQAKAEAGR
jgi:hypothetical protein